MATLSDLVLALARVTGIAEATVFSYGRFAREAGLIAQKGHGRGAATMKLSDAANLLIAVGATDVTREAAAAIRDFRPMRGDVAPLREQVFRDKLLEWFAPILQKAGRMVELKVDFGTFLEFLIERAGDGHLAQVLRKIPTTEIPPKLWRRMVRAGEFSDYSVDRLVDEGIIKIKRPNEVVIGEDVQLSVKFVRTTPRVDVEIKRMWDTVEEIVAFQFFPYGSSRDELIARTKDFALVAELTQHTLMAVGLTLSDIHIPPGLHTAKELRQYLSNVEAALTGYVHSES